MNATDALERGREAFWRQAWVDAYTRLSAADRDADLPPEDLEHLATAAYLQQLPVSGSHRLHRHRLGGGDWSSWTSAAERGLFAYDWDSSTAGEYVPGQPYWLVASPEIALTVERLPPSIREYLQPIRFGAPFGDDVFPERAGWLCCRRACVWCLSHFPALR